jgi:hypothetical protein
MAEDTMVRMLMEVAGGNVVDDRDIALARAAGRWAHAIAGWQPYPDGGFVFDRGFLSYWVAGTDGAGQYLEIRVGPGGGNWHTHLATRIDHVGHALNILAAEDLIPARFSTLGRQALDDYATASERSAQVMIEMADDFDREDLASAETIEPWELRIRADTLLHAAAQMRAFPGAELAVMT